MSAKSRLKRPNKTPRPIAVPVFMYFVGFETVPGAVVGIAGDPFRPRGVRKQSMIFKLPGPIRTSAQLRDLERMIGAKIAGTNGGGGEVIITACSLLESLMVPLTEEQEAAMKAAMEKAVQAPSPTPPSAD